jgi:two-component system, OmpR family, sensor kinase
VTRRPLAIRTRLTLWYGAVLAATIVALGALVWVSTAAILRGSLDEALRVQAADVRSGLGRTLSVAVTRLDPAQPGIFTAVLGPGGVVRQRSSGVPAGLREPAAGASTEHLPPDGEAYAVLAESAPGGQTIVVGSSLAAVDRDLGSLAALLVGIGIAGFAASLGGGWLLSGRALAPVARLTGEANVIGAADLERRLPEPVRLDEIGRLVRTLNGMLDRVAASVRRERAFVSAASHDLRTPIAALRTELELAARNPTDEVAMLSAIQVAHADAVRLSTLAADLLGLAEAEASGRALVCRPVVVPELIDAAISVVQPLAAERSTTIQVMAPDDVVDVDRVRLEQALVNLLSNAIRESPIGSSVDVVVDVDSGRRTGAASPDGTPGWLDATLEVAVLDRGPGVAAGVRQVLFVPFASRARGRADGTGLGLATAAAAIRTHGGEIGYEDRPGGGATFRFRVPTRVLETTGIGED